MGVALRVTKRIDTASLTFVLGDLECDRLFIVQAVWRILNLPFHPPNAKAHAPAHRHPRLQ